MNPFIYIPYGSNGLELQEQWIEGENDKYTESTKIHEVTIELLDELNGIT